MTVHPLQDELVRAAPTPTFVAFTRLRADGDVEVVLRGALDAATLPVLSAILDSVQRMDASHVCLDLADVTSWSLLVEGAVLSTARRLEASGNHLFLTAPGEELRRQGSRLDLFSRIPLQT